MSIALPQALHLAPRLLFLTLTQNQSAPQILNPPPMRVDQ